MKPKRDWIFWATVVVCGVVASFLAYVAYYLYLMHTGAIPNPLS